MCEDGLGTHGVRLSFVIRIFNTNGDRLWQALITLVHINNCAIDCKYKSEGNNANPLFVKWVKYIKTISNKIGRQDIWYNQSLITCKTLIFF